MKRYQLITSLYLLSAFLCVICVYYILPDAHIIPRLLLSAMGLFCILYGLIILIDGVEVYTRGAVK